jgi:hypothetical protein
VGLNDGGEVRGPDTPRADDLNTVGDSMRKPIQDGIPRLNYYFGSLQDFLLRLICGLMDWAGDSANLDPTTIRNPVL